MAEVRTQLGNGPVYLSFDIDALDPGFAPGTGTPEIAGLTPIQVMCDICMYTIYALYIYMYTYRYKYILYMFIYVFICIYTVETCIYMYIYNNNNKIYIKYIFILYIYTYIYCIHTYILFNLEVFIDSTVDILVFAPDSGIRDYPRLSWSEPGRM